MAKPAELGTQNLEMSRLRGCEMKRKVQPRHEILLNPQFANIEGVADVFCMHQEMNLPVHGDGHLCRDDVISRFHIVRRIQSEIVLIPFIDLVWMKRSKLSVRSGIAKIKSKLACLRLHLQSVRFGRRKIHFGPSFLSKYAQSQNFRADKNKRSYNHQSRATTQVEDLSSFLPVGKLPHTKSQKKLSQHKRKPGFRHGIRQLFINRMPVRGNVHRLHVHVSHDRVRRSKRNNRENDSEKFSHITSTMPALTP